MAALPLALIYAVLGFFALALLTSPVLVVWRAFWIRPLQRKFRKIQGKKPRLSRDIQQSPLFRWTKSEADVLHNTRTRALFSLFVLLLLFACPILLQGYRWPEPPKDLDGFNKVMIDLGGSLYRGAQKAGAVWVGLGVLWSAVGSLLLVNVLDLLGEALGLPFRAARDRGEKPPSPDEQTPALHPQSDQSRPEEALGPAEATAMTNFYVAFGIRSVADGDEIRGRLGMLAKAWKKRLKEAAKTPEGAGDREKAKAKLAMISEATEVLLKPDRRAQYDQQIGVRKSPRDLDVSLDALDSAVRKDIETKKQIRKAMRTSVLKDQTPGKGIDDGDSATH